MFRYKDLATDPKSMILQVSRFLGTTVPDNQMNQLVNHISYKEFSQNDAVNRGRILKALYPKNPKKHSIFATNEELNPPRNKLSAEQLAMLDYWSKKNTKDSDFDYKQLGMRSSN